VNGPTLIGRDSELERLYQALRHGERAGTTLLLHGEPGIGKSALLDATRAAALERGFAVLETAGAATEAGWPYAGLERLLRPLFARIPDLRLQRRLALETALGRGDIPSPHPLLVAFGVLDLLAAHAGQRTLLVLLDDAHWLDSASRTVLGLVGRNLNDHRICIVAATRTRHREASDELGFAELVVTGLDDTASVEILAIHGGALSTDARDRLVVEAAGNPLALIELSALGTAEMLEGEREGLPPISERIERAFAVRVQEMPDATRSLLLVAAADETSTVDEILTAGTRLRPGGVRSDLDVAEAGGLISTRDGRVLFRHPLVGAAVYRDATLDDRLAAHAALAVAVGDDLDRRAHHRAAATVRSDDEVAAEVEAAAERARTRGAVLEAAQTLRRSADLTNDAQVRVKRLLDAAELAFEAGQADLVRETVEEARTLELTTRDRAKADLLSEIFSDGVVGDVSRVLGLVEDARSVAALGDHDLALELLQGAAVRCWWAGLEEPVRDEVLVMAEDLPVQQDDPRLMAIVACVAPLERGAEIVERMPRALTDVGDDPIGRWWLAMAAHAVNDHALSLQILTDLIPTLRSHGRFGLLTQALSMAQWDAAMLGEWELTASMAAEGAHLANDTGQRVWGAGLTCGLSAAAAIRGNPEAAERFARDAEQVIVVHRLADMHSVLLTTRGIAAVAAGRYDDAFETLTRALDPDDPGYHYREKFGALAFLADAAAGSNRADDGQRIIDAAAETVGPRAAPALHTAIALARRRLGRNT
jgi:hypothetical protein